jgi:hypothetical protein
VLRDVWVGIKRFDDIQRDLGISRPAARSAARVLCDEDYALLEVLTGSRPAA